MYIVHSVKIKYGESGWVLWAPGSSINPLLCDIFNDIHVILWNTPVYTARCCLYVHIKCRFRHSSGCVPVSLSLVFIQISGWYVSECDKFDRMAHINVSTLWIQVQVYVNIVYHVFISEDV